MSNKNFALVCVISILVFWTGFFICKNWWFASGVDKIVDQVDEGSVSLPNRTSGENPFDRQRIRRINSNGQKNEVDKKRPLPKSVGRSPLLPADKNPATSLIEMATKAKAHPERLTVFSQSEPFDHEAYLNEPEKYLDAAVPSRVFQSAQPGPGVRVIKRKGPAAFNVLQGDSVFLSVQVVGDAPVSFYSPNLGSFSNGLTSITIQADKEGLAVASFQASPGTNGITHVLAASPLTSGQIRFVIEVDSPVN